jgi:DNA-binding response OmpR family regulator
MKILLLEDDALLGDAIEKYLTVAGHMVELFARGDRAYEMLQKTKYDLLVLDINVPGVDGLTLLERLHELKIQTPTIFISALVDIEDISRAYDLGCYDYLKKPFHLKELVIKIDKILQGRHTPTEHFRLSENYSYHMEERILRFRDEVQILSSRRQQIIRLLVSNRSRVVSYDMFREYVWGDTYVDDATIRAEVNRLKKALREDIIINVRSVGYMIDRPKD